MIVNLIKGDIVGPVCAAAFYTASDMFLNTNEIIPVFFL